MTKEMTVAFSRRSRGGRRASHGSSLMFWFPHEKSGLVTLGSAQQSSPAIRANGEDANDGGAERLRRPQLYALAPFLKSHPSGGNCSVC